MNMIKNINTLTKKQFQKQSSFVEKTRINSQMQVLKDSTNNNQQRRKIVLKYKEATNFQVQNHEKILMERRNFSQSNKQNQNVVQDKKVKLTLKPFTPRELGSTKQNQLEQNKKFKQQKIKQVNSVSKTAVNQKQSISDQRQNQNKFNGYFKPSVIYFSLKNTQQNQKKTDKSPHQSVQTNKDLSKQIRPKKNYQLAAFIAQFVHKLTHQQLNDDTKNTKRFSYSQFVQILRALFMIRYSSECDYKIEIQDQKEQLQKVYLLWRIFKANTFITQIPQCESVHYFLINFILLLTAILKIHVETFEELNEIFIDKLSNRMQKQNEHINSNKEVQNIMEPSHIFFIKNKKLLNKQPKIIVQGIPFIDFSDQIKSQLFKEFEVFRINRLPAQNSLKTVKLQLGNENSSQQFDFGSLLSPRSQQLAQTKRMKILEEIKKNVHVNLDLKEKPNDNKLNLFLSYKSPRSCQNKLIKDSQEGHTHTKRSQLLKQKQKKTKNIAIEPPKIKISELNVVLNMQKGRKLKRQKQMILQKGWTNSGAFDGKDLRQKQNRVPKSLSKGRNQHYSNQNSCKKKAANGEQVNYFELRKNSLRGMRILAEKLQNTQKYEQNEQGFRDFDELFLTEQNQQSQTHREVQPLDGISNSTITIKDNQCFDLQQQGEFNHGTDFILEDAFEFEHGLRQESFIATTLWKNNNNLTNLCEKLRQQPLEGFSFKLKTFNTQQNEFPQDDSSHSEVKAQRSNKQARVIKSYLKIPILYVDVNMDDGKKERIIIYEEDDPFELAMEFGQKHKLGTPMINKLEEMLKQQIGGILGRIDEEDDQYNDTKEQIANE